MDARTKTGPGGREIYCVPMNSRQKFSDILKRGINSFVLNRLKHVRNDENGILC